MQTIQQFFDATSSTFTYVLIDPASREAAIVDAVDHHLQRDLDLLRAQHLRLKWVIETHAHADHITSAGDLARLTGAMTATPAKCGISPALRQLSDGDTLELGDRIITALHTPGHTAGSMCFLWDNAVLTGDTLLIGGCGRTDFQSGSAEALYDSITTKLFTLPDSTRVLPGHDYNGKTESTIGAEKATNPRLAGKSRAEFVEMMAALKLAPPRLLDVAVSANQRLGDPLPVVEEVFEAEGYAGNVSPATAHAWLSRGEAVMIDVRTQAERDWVGFVGGSVLIPWKIWPGMLANENFDKVLTTVAKPEQRVLFLCRSGARSVEAAKRATILGYQAAYNILEGFEGDPDTNKQRGHLNGWRHAGLPWMQG